MTPSSGPAGRKPLPTRRQFLFSAGAATVGAAGLAQWVAGQNNGPRADARPDGRGPNFILILADDLGYGELGSYGQRLMRTPNLDGMAAQGLRFTDFYSAAPVCAPARASLLTGLHTGHARVRDNPQGGDVDLTHADTTVAEVLQRLGYRTGLFGKWGFGTSGPDQESHPLEQGFNDFFGYLTHREAHSYYPPLLWDQERELVFPANDAGMRKVFGPALCLERSMRFLERNKARPFFMMLSPPMPHAPSIAPSAGPYEGLGWNRPDTMHAAQVTLLDDYVGQVLAKVRQLGLADNTIVMVTSDNGPHEEGGFNPDFFDAAGGLRGLKRSLYEGGIRVPCIAWSPKLLARSAGQTTTAPTGLWDLFPTFVEMAGGESPDGLDGRSLARLMTGTGDVPAREYLYWARPRGVKQTPRMTAAEKGRSNRASAAVRFGKWKVVGFAPGPTYSEPNEQWDVELYDLLNDPAETADLAADHQDVVERGVEYLREAWVPPA